MRKNLSNYFICEMLTYAERDNKKMKKNSF